MLKDRIILLHMMRSEHLRSDKNIAWENLNKGAEYNEDAFLIYCEQHGVNFQQKNEVT